MSAAPLGGYWANKTPEERAAIRARMSAAHQARRAAGIKPGPKSLPPDKVAAMQKGARRWRDSLTPEQREEQRRKIGEGMRKAHAARKALLEGARQLAEAAGDQAVEEHRQRVTEDPLPPPAPVVDTQTKAVPALIVKGAASLLMIRAGAILDAGLAAARQAIAVQLEEADGARHVAELALAFVRADAKSRATFDALVALRRAALAWDETRGGGR
ncbi:MAG: hypothetical protein HY825_13505 [Acidobacteria bacterium]|nr:hypothetical protein [Acidobacteriota bacterium]